MKFRRKLLLLFALTIVMCVAAVAFLISYLTRRTFEAANHKRSTAVVDQFSREFARVAISVSKKVKDVAEGELVQKIAVSINQGPPDYGAYLNAATSIADAQHLDLLDFIDDQGTVLSSAEWPARFGYKSALPSRVPGTFFAREDLPDASVLAVCAMQEVKIGSKPLFVVGGQRIDRTFVMHLDVPFGMRALLYENPGPGAQAPYIIDPFGLAPATGPVQSLINSVQRNSQSRPALVHWSANDEDDELVHALPLFDPDHQLLGHFCSPSRSARMWICAVRFVTRAC